MGKVPQRKRHRQSSRVHHPCIARPATMPMAAFAPSLRRNRLGMPRRSLTLSSGCWRCRTKTRRGLGKKRCATSTHIVPIASSLKVSIDHGALDLIGQQAARSNCPRPQQSASRSLFHVAEDYLGNWRDRCHPRNRPLRSATRAFPDPRRRQSATTRVLSRSHRWLDTLDLLDRRDDQECWVSGILWNPCRPARIFSPRSCGTGRAGCLPRPSRPRFRGPGTSYVINRPFED
jgi:hypothetical protein